MVPLYDNIGGKKRIAPLTTSLIVLNFAIFLFTLTLSNYTMVSLMDKLGAAEHTHPASWVLLIATCVSLFLHANFLHVFFNMLFLYAFGTSIENKLGRVRFLVLYFGAGFTGSLFFSLFS